MILHIENLKMSPKTTRTHQWIQKTAKLKYTKGNLFHFYTLTTNYQKEKLWWKQFHLHCIKKNKIPLNKNLLKEVKIYTQKIIKHRERSRWDILCSLNWKELILLTWPYSPRQCIDTKSKSKYQWLFHRTRTNT